jgi:hypothetical protein
MKRWLQGAALGLLAVVAILVGAMAWLFGPYAQDDWVLDRAVRAAALDWRDFGIVEARQRLQFEMDRGGVGMHVQDEDCVFAELRPRRVTCAWNVTVEIPGTELRVPLAFESAADVPFGP